ncbi:MAG: prepilin-type N-terminal cleavage/methylation domain-containing protein [Gammaproteobacteria bacterium]|nr:prepilin-type N-terminal cleavage/methylation domain-containing protein [Gammaproteobacteria bacterium]
MNRRKSTRGPSFKGSNGFTLIELMIVIGVVALLVALALPSYKQFIRKSNRGEAQQLMMNYANLQEIWRSNNSTYATAANLAPPTSADYNYNFFVRATAADPPTVAQCANQAPTAAAYTGVACAKGGNDQNNDKQAGTSCARMGLTQANTKVPNICW